MLRKLSLPVSSVVLSLCAMQPALAQHKFKPGVRPTNSTLTLHKTKLHVHRMLSFQIPKNIQASLETMQWTMEAGSKGRQILSGNRYRLFNLVSQRGLKRQKRTAGANLGWLTPKSSDFTVRVRRLSGNGQVRYGDIVALELKSYGWLKYKKRKYGINISDDNHKPHYIWVIKGGAKGTKLVSGMPFALHSAKARTSMTYCKRVWGINLGYKGKSKCGGRISSLTTKVFGENGLLNKDDGLTGQGVELAKSRLCEMAVGAIVAGVGVGSGGLTAGVVALGAKKAISECKKL